MNVLSNILLEEEVIVINFKNNVYIFFIFINNKKELRFKDNLIVSTNNAQRNSKGTFARDVIIAIDNDIFRNRVFNMKKKTTAL